MFKHKRNIIRYKVNSGFIAQKVGNKTTIFSGEDSMMYLKQVVLFVEHGDSG